MQHIRVELIIFCIVSRAKTKKKKNENYTPFIFTLTLRRERVVCKHNYNFESALTEGGRACSDNSENIVLEHRG